MSFSKRWRICASSSTLHHQGTSTPFTFGHSELEAVKHDLAEGQSVRVTGVQVGGHVPARGLLLFPSVVGLAHDRLVSQRRDPILEPDIGAFRSSRGRERAATDGWDAGRGTGRCSSPRRGATTPCTGESRFGSVPRGTSRTDRAQISRVPILSDWIILMILPTTVNMNYLTLLGLTRSLRNRA